MVALLNPTVLQIASEIYTNGPVIAGMTAYADLPSYQVGVITIYVHVTVTCMHAFVTETRSY